MKNWSSKAIMTLIGLDSPIDTPSPGIRFTWVQELSLGAQKNNISSHCWVQRWSTSHRRTLQRRRCTRTHLWGEINDFIKAVTLNCDNQGAIMLSRDNKFHTWTKHIDIQYHFIQEAVKDIIINYVATNENPVDIFTKPLAKVKFCCFVEMLGLKHLIWCLQICWWDSFNLCWGIRVSLVLLD